MTRKSVGNLSKLPNSTYNVYIPKNEDDSMEEGKVVEKGKEEEKVEEELKGKEEGRKGGKGKVAQAVGGRRTRRDVGLTFTNVERKKGAGRKNMR